MSNNICSAHHFFFLLEDSEFGFVFWNYICYNTGFIRDIYANLFNERIWYGKGEGEIANFSQFSTISMSPDKILARGISGPYGDL